MIDPDGQALWDFALDFYGRDGVRHACLRLQDDAGADVPLLIFVCFAATRGQAFAFEDLLKIEDEGALWRRGVIGNLRVARRVLGSWDDDGSRDLKEIVRKAELEAERLQLFRFARYLTQPTPATAAEARDLGRSSVTAYAMLVPASDSRHLEHLLSSLG
ncbi:MAG: TIGR02444 family protein [Candidatus Andeanibacterium colombiense]|uniref:TIGR02444 family protein n=1 Tax=Candidatus Andeanibacterium colombiense TaxID=3121345 RepID=A0AAJ5XAQ9_9SPHN|nr:MAG: TIGR02444 family protein [Sphingomonadaceae bacterium]